MPCHLHVYQEMPFRMTSKKGHVVLVNKGKWGSILQSNSQYLMWCHTQDWILDLYKTDTIIHTKLSYSTQDDVIGEMFITQTDLDARKFGYFRFCTVIFGCLLGILLLRTLYFFIDHNF